jgi:hypothetical protein
MKRLIIIVAIALLFLGAIRAWLRTQNDLDDEMESYVKNLHYKFSARVDSIEILNAKRQRGFLICHLTKGKLNEITEDSLNRHLVNYKRIRFLRLFPNGQFKILFLGGIFKYQPSDSVVVNSNLDEFKIFRNDEIILDSHVSQSLLYKVYFAFWLHD